MPYRIDSTYCWHRDWVGENERIVLMYYINGIPFTYDELEDVLENDAWLPAVKMIADNETTEDLYNHHAYLMEEECHPLVFDLELENPEKLPVD